MKKFFINLRDVALAGFLFLLPVYILFILLNKAWTSLSSIGVKIAEAFGVKSIFGLGGSTVFSGLLMILLWLLCGWLVRFSLVATFKKKLDRWFSQYIPGYETYKMMAEEKLQKQARMLSYQSILLKQPEGWQPGYIVDRDQEGNSLVFLPDIPETNRGHLLIVPSDQVKFIPSLTALQLESALKKMGKGLLQGVGGNR